MTAVGKWKSRAGVPNRGSRCGTAVPYRAGSNAPTGYASPKASRPSEVT